MVRVSLEQWCIDNNKEYLLKEWDYDKNSLNPNEISYTSFEKVWWKCCKNHNWSIGVRGRTRGNGCPICSSHKVLKGYNDLSITNPNLLKEWHPVKNGDLKPTDFSSGSGEKVWWIGECGHEWESRISVRSKNFGCPICYNRKVLIGYNDLATTNPKLAKEWHPTKNGDLKPTDFVAGSSKTVWWKCIYNHEWTSTIFRRNTGRECPICSRSIGTSFPEQCIYFYLSKVFKNVKNNYQFKFENKKYEIDIFIPSLNLGIEYDGVNFHSNEDRIKKDELKNKLLKENNITLIRIRENGCPKINMFNQIEIISNSKSSNKYKDFKNIINLIIDYIKENYSLSIKEINNLKNINIDINIDRNSILEGYLYNKKEKSLLFKNNDLAKEWHPTKNGKLKPNLFSITSNKKVWWICKKGHEWEANIRNRSSGNNCPYCANKKVLKGFNDLATTNPNLAKEWHPTKNGDLKPTEFTSGSSKKVWWLGDCEHEWESLINVRNNDSNCPYCSSQKVLKGFNDLETTNPNLAKEWHPTKNSDLKPTDFTKGSNIKVWWLGSCNHEWESSISSRNNGIGCSICSNKQVLIGFNDLETLNPKLAKEWHPIKNGDLKPTNVSKSSAKKVWWLCKEGHEWKTTISNRNNGNNCPYCSNQKILKGFNDLETLNPKLAKEWHPTKNGTLKPTDITKGTNKKVWWLGSCKHEWLSSISNRSKGKNCPYCSGIKAIIGENDLATTHPYLIKEWHPSKNGELTPTQFKSGSNKKVWWLCSNCNKEYERLIANQTRKNVTSKCPHCKIEIK